MKLFNQYRKYVLMAPAGEGDAGGGDGGGSLITEGDAGGGGDKGGDGGAAAAAAAKAAADKAAGDKGGGGDSWLTSLPKEMQGDENLKKFKGVSDLAGAYNNLQKLMGSSDKIAVPNAKTATAADWENVYNKLGRPSLDKYEIKFKDGITIDKNFSEAFRTNAHKAGLLPQQAQSLADWFSELNVGAEQKYAAQSKANFEKQVGELRTEWGNAFDAKIGRVNKMLADMGASKYFKDKGYGSDPMIFKYLDYAAERLYKDHKLVDGNNNGGKQVRTPNEIKAAIGKMQVDTAYLSKDHPGHAAAVQEMAALHQELHPPVDKK